MDSIRQTLSLHRMSTFDKAVSGSTADPLDLYNWNAQLASALIYPFHIFEVSVRNAVSDAIGSTHTTNWHKAVSFERSLKKSKHGYCPKDDLAKVARKHYQLSKAIPEFKFVFWEKMLTARYQKQIWDNHIYRVFPNHSMLGLSKYDLREHLRKRIESVREVRNRVAHHEQILKFDIPLLLANMEQVIQLRCTDTSNWMMANQQVLEIYRKKPIGN
ncbi:hypothetical protein DN730_06385 [Marinomonas piezotolerans]|uniref:CAAX protease n=1 Tax=Marinomonas piezotolerans TaxID=2213058 RepID=A0A370UBT9_9GAMM|nr:Abi family protein [Marinomonas piezotolerans]RDL45234.1 hypothetical protein DN730_06385 [Marinomonas piezotolerans]